MVAKLSCVCYLICCSAGVDAGLLPVDGPGQPEDGAGGRGGEGGEGGGGLLLGQECSQLTAADQTVGDLLGGDSAALLADLLSSTPDTAHRWYKHSFLVLKAHALARKIVKLLPHQIRAGQLHCPVGGGVPWQ